MYTANENVRARTVNHYFNAAALRRLLIWNDTGSITHLWFLFALLYCYLFLYFILLPGTSKIDYRVIDVTAFLLWVVLIVFSEVLPIFSNNVNVIYYRNALFTGFPFFWFGLRLKTKPFEKKLH